MFAEVVGAEFGKEIVLQLDSKTHWNNVLSMLERRLGCDIVCTKL
jgi:hypothetical protein